MQRKLKLDLETLTVDSYPTGAPEPRLRGTVRGREAYCPWSQPFSCQATVHTCASFDRSC